MSDARIRVVREARRSWGSDAHRRVDWDAVERGLFDRIDAERRAERGALWPSKGHGWKAVAAALAAAAAVALVGKMQDRRSLEPQRASADDEAATIVAVEGGGDVLIDGRRATVGAVLRLGDVIETRAAQVTLKRAGKLAFAVERDSSATVTHVHGALVLDLGEGAVEAQVVPVATGEAFAVDVGRSRVAVHGTHLRVARAGPRVVVDLNDGVLSVGDAPRVGPTLGALVTAPAHAEFSDGDAQGTLLVTHDPSSVRAPVSFGQPSQSKSAAQVLEPSVSVAASASARAEPPSQATALPSTPHAEARALVANPGPPPAPAMPDPNAQAAISAAVRACMAERLHAEDVTVVVSTTLYLDLQDDGSVRSARFEPPVAPDVNACAARSIYKTRFTHAGAVTIPVSFKN
ncbi:MAG TPA: hypothetical protein VE987_12645 [Polyangiaceae bacterium]|nr:hypothetical protein [Polyangiaceae bacterium]